MVVDEMVDQAAPAGEPGRDRPGALAVPLTILEGSTFCVSDELGDISEPTMGLFADDTRFLSRWVLTINGARPLMLSSRKVEYYSAAFFLRNPVVGRPRRRTSSRSPASASSATHAGAPRRRRTTRTRRVEFELALEIGNDFADIFAVKALRLRARATPTMPGPSRPPCRPCSSPRTTSSCSCPATTASTA